MKRKYVYGLLSLPILLFLIYLAAAGESRDTFFTEFKHNVRSMMGYRPPTYGTEKGLRSEHPDEYGHAYDAEPSEVEDASPEDNGSENEDNNKDGTQSEAANHTESTAEEVEETSTPEPAP